MPLDVPAQKNPKIRRIAIFLVALFITIAFLGLLLLYVNKLASPFENTTSFTSVAPPAVSSTTNSLGGQIYEKAQNPLDGKLETQAPAANPINDAYKNPFE